MPRTAPVVAALALACAAEPVASRTPLVAVAAGDVRVALEGHRIAVRVPFTVTNRGADPIQLDGCGAALEQSIAGAWRVAAVMPCSGSQVPPSVSIPPVATRADVVRFTGDLTGAEPPYWEGTVPPAGRFRLRLPLRAGAQRFGDAAVSPPFDVAGR